MLLPGGELANPPGSIVAERYAMADADNIPKPEDSAGWSGSLPVRPGDAVHAGDSLGEIRDVAAYSATVGQHITLTIVPVGRRAAGVPAWLEASDGRRWFLEREAGIGRDVKNDIHLEDRSVSRFHARLERTDDGYLIIDNASLNRVKINGRIIEKPHLLRPGDQAKLGDVTLTFNLDTDGQITQAIVGDNVTQPVQPLPTSPDNQPFMLDAEVRVITTLFVDLKGYTMLSAGLAAPRLVTVMRECYELLSRVPEHFGGHVSKFLGDGLMILFGATTAHTDHAERAVRAGLAMQAAMARLTARLVTEEISPLHLRVGIATGEAAVFTLRGQIDALGISVNLAKRLETAGTPGGVLVSEATYRLTRQAIRYAARPPLMVTNFEEPITAYDALGLADDMPDTRLDSGVVGRGATLARLAGLLAAAARAPQAVTLLGEAGVGKSRLLVEWQRSEAGAARWAVVRCVEPDRRTSYAILRRLVRALLRGEGDATPQPADISTTFWEQPHDVWLVRNLLNDQFMQARAVPPAQLRELFAQELGRRLREFARPLPVALGLDDAQWADDASLDVLDAILTQGRPAPVLLLAVARPSWSRRWSGAGEVLHLGRLDSADSGRLVTLLLRSATVEPSSADLLAQRSGGNPRLLEELVRAYAEDGRLREEGGRWQVRAEEFVVGTTGPLELRAVVQSRLDSLPADDRRVLQVGAAIGTICTIGALARALEADLPLRDILRRLVEHHFLVEQIGDGESSYAFPHADLRLVALAGDRPRDQIGRVQGAS
jgi:class 3 adenylate cyclase